MGERTIRKIELNEKERALLWAATAYNQTLTEWDRDLDSFIRNRISLNRRIRLQQYQYVMTEDNENLYIMEKEPGSEQA